MASVCFMHRGPVLGKPTAIENESQMIESGVEAMLSEQIFGASLQAAAGPMERPLSVIATVIMCSERSKHHAKLPRSSRMNPSLCRTRLTVRR